MLQTKLTSAVVGVTMSVTSLMSTVTSVTAEPFIGEVRAFGENFCPRGWGAADGSLLPISQNTALFSILGTIYGGDGRSIFGLTQLLGRTTQFHCTRPWLRTTRIGEQVGAQTRALTEAQMPSHSHAVNATNVQGNKLGPGGDILADPNTGDPNTEVQIYHDGSVTPNRVMDQGMIAPQGGSQPINVQSPVLALKWCVALIGVYPSRS